MADFRKKMTERTYDFTNLGNSYGFENMDTAIVDLVQTMTLAIQSGDEQQAKAYIESAMYRGFLEQLRQTPEFVVTSYIYNCVVAYTIAMGAVSSFTGAQKLLEMTTKARYSSVEEYLDAITETVLAFTALVKSERKKETLIGPTGRACAYIRDHLFVRFALEELAAYCGCSLSRLRHRFREETGLSLTDYIRREKLEKAKQMLRGTDYTVAQIANQLGFCSESYFITVFRKEVGSTPRRFRDRMQ